MSIYLQTFGHTGPRILLLSGSGCPVEHVHPLAEALSVDHRVLVPWFPGYGRTPRHAGVYSMDVDRALLRDALRAAEVRELRAIVGVSFGAYRALSLATEGFPVASLVCLGGFATLAPPEREGTRGFAALARTGAVPAGLLSARYLSPAYLVAHRDVAEEIETWPAHFDLEAIADELAAAADAVDLRPALAKLDVPVLARVGEHDVAATVAHSEEIAAACPRGTLQIVPGAGHLLLTEDFAATLVALRSAVGGAGS